MQILWVRVMSDNFKIRSLSGNFQSQWEEPWREIRRMGKKRLVEESVEVAISFVRKAFGKSALMAAIRQARPVRLSVLGGSFDLWLVYQLHRLPGTLERWSSLETHNCRLWLQCRSCRRVVAKLYYFYLAPDSLALSDLHCRKCHGLVYQSQNCGENRWYEEIARPLKRFLQEKHKLLAKQWTPRIGTRLARIEDEIRTLREMARPITDRRKRNPLFRSSDTQRRPYRDVALLERWAALRS
jgi:hypothetical protein